MDKEIYDRQYWKFSAYGFLKNLKFFDPFIVLFFLETGLKFFEIGILISVREITINILEIPTGIAADTLGRRKSLIFAFISYIVSFGIFFFSKHFYTHLMGMVFFGIGEAFRSGTHKAMILEYLRSKDLLKFKVLYYGHTRSWSQIGSAVSAVLAGVIVFLSSGYRYIFLFSILPYLAALVLVASYSRKLDFAHQTDTSELTPFRNRFSVAIGTLKSMLKEKEARKLLLNSSVFDAVFKSAKDYLQPVLLSIAVGLPFLLTIGADKKISIVSAIVYFLIYILTSFAAKSSGPFCNRFRSHERAGNAMFLLSVLLLFFIGILLYGGLSLLPVLFFILFYLLENLRKPAIIGILSDRIPSSVMASGFSVDSLLKTGIVAVLAPVLGFLIDLLGTGLAFLILALFLLSLYPFVKLSEN